MIIRNKEFRNPIGNHKLKFATSLCKASIHVRNAYLSLSCACADKTANLARKTTRTKKLEFSRFSHRTVHARAHTHSANTASVRYRIFRRDSALARYNYSIWKSSGCLLSRSVSPLPSWLLMQRTVPLRRPTPARAPMYYFVSAPGRVFTHSRTPPPPPSFPSLSEQQQQQSWQCISLKLGCTPCIGVLFFN